MAYSSTYGTLTTRGQVERAVITVLSTAPNGGTAPLLVYYLAELERQQGLAPRTIPVPPAPDSYRGGVDFANWQQTWLPQIIVTAQPTGDAERYSSETSVGSYAQWYELEVAAIVISQEGEDHARRLADWYGTALAGALVQPAGAGLGPRVDPISGATVPFAEKTVLIVAPRTELVESHRENRQLARSVVVLHTLVQQVAQEQGPLTFLPDPYATPAAWPTVVKVDVQLQAENPASVFSPGTGVTVTTPDGAVSVNE